MIKTLKTSRLITTPFLITTLLVSPLTITKANSATASWYGGVFHNRTTASGERFNKWAMTCASNTHKMGTKLRVTNVSNGKSITVKVNDRGGFTKYGRTLDLSRGAFAKIADIDKGLIKVKIKVIN